MFGSFFKSNSGAKDTKTPDPKPQPTSTSQQLNINTSSSSKNVIEQCKQLFFTL